MNTFVLLRAYVSTCKQYIFVFSVAFCFIQTLASGQYSMDEATCADVEISVFDHHLLDSISLAHVSRSEKLDTFYFEDNASPATCSWSDFNGPFDIDYWTFYADNDDGYLHVDSIPRAVYLEGASNSPNNGTNRYVTSLKIEAPTSGYVSFDWLSFGGNFPHIDAFYFTINDSCVQLSNQYQTQGDFVSWYLNEGDTISLEQTSNGSANHITTKVFNFKFVPELYQAVDRKWIMVEGYDTTTCLQRIEVTRPSLGVFQVPPNMDGHDSPAISCTANLSDVEFGFPSYSSPYGHYILGDTAWNNYSTYYTDEILSRCGASQKIRRWWTILDHCSGASIASSQIIEIADDTEIEIACPKDQRFIIKKCEVTVGIRKPKAWTSCNEHVDVDIEWAYGTGSGYYYNVVPGKYEIKFTAKDGCGRSKTCSMWLDLVYEEQADVSCKSDIEVQLPKTGTLTMAVSDLVHYTPNCTSNFQFEIDGKSTLILDCNDIGTQYYTISYFDPANAASYGSCTIALKVSNAEILYRCPNDRTIACSADLSSLNAYGVLELVNGLDQNDVEYNETRNLNNCNVGHIIRSWNIRTQCGQVERCTQRITVNPEKENPSVFWPEDYLVDFCANPNPSLDPSDLPAMHSAPIVTGSYCGSSTFSHSDVQIGAGSCFEIRRTWIGTNSCNPSQVYSHTQILEIRPSEDIALDVPSDQVVFLSECEMGSTFVQINSASASSCGGETQIQNDSPHADQNGSNASGTYPIGLTDITFTATDPCGNITTETVTIEVVPSDQSSSTNLRCVGEYDAVLEPDEHSTASVSFTATQLVASAGTDPCTNYTYQYAFSQDIADTTRTVTCNDLGFRSFRVYRLEQDLSWSSCEAWVSVIDPQDYCTSSVTYGVISGSITTPSGDPVQFVNIDLPEIEEVNTDETGAYSVGEVPVGQSIDIIPSKEINDRNGINTLDLVRLNRHLLGTQFLSSPYSIIACDVNNSGSVSVGDLFMMNKLILGIETELDQSWKFIPSDYLFSNPADPFAEQFPRYIAINISGDQNGLDFIGVKSGDPNYSADPTKLIDSEVRDAEVVFLKNASFEKGESVELVLDLPSDRMIDGLQFTLSYDPGKLRFERGTSTFGLDPSLVLNTTQINEGSIGVVFVNYKNNLNVPSLRLEFTALEAGRFSEDIHSTSFLYYPELYRSSKVADLHLEFHQERTLDDAIEVYPNPFSERLHLVVEVPESGQYKVVAHDILGRQVMSRKSELNQGKNTITLSNQDFENEGIYVLRVHGHGIMLSRQVVRVD